MPVPLSAWKYLLWTPSLPSTQHRQLWELFEQERSTDRRRLIWRDERIRKWILHWCAEEEREVPRALWGWMHFSWACCACVKDCCFCVAFTCLSFFCSFFWNRNFMDVFLWVAEVFFFFATSLSAKVQACVAGSFCQLKGLRFCLCHFRDGEMRTWALSSHTVDAFELKLCCIRPRLHLVAEWRFSHQPELTPHSVFSGKRQCCLWNVRTGQ